MVNIAIYWQCTFLLAVVLGVIDGPSYYYVFDSYSIIETLQSFIIMYNYRIVCCFVTQVLTRLPLVIMNDSKNVEFHNPLVIMNDSKNIEFHNPLVIMNDSKNVEFHNPLAIMNDSKKLNFITLVIMNDSLEHLISYLSGHFD